MAIETDKYKVEAICPYCGIQNRYYTKHLKEGMNIVTCGPRDDTPGCERKYVIDVQIYLMVNVYETKMKSHEALRELHKKHEEEEAKFREEHNIPDPTSFENRPSKVRLDNITELHDKIKDQHVPPCERSSLGKL